MLEKVFELECTGCGHAFMDNHPWKKCMRPGCNGNYKVKREYPAGK
ncbi:MAG: hypothetical protein K8E24_003295 [Methanobacterium paludis]|nr:hypothetical protein [Methanobacterium paludis]